MIKRYALLSILTMLVLVGCDYDFSDVDENEIVENGGSYEKITESDDEVKMETKGKLKILAIYSIDAETDDFDRAQDELKEITHNHGGYISSNKIVLNEYGREGEKREAEVQLRVPSDKVTILIRKIKSQLEIKSETMDSVDMTDEYYDIDTRIKDLEKREKRLESLYNKSTDVEDALMIDEKIAEVNEKKSSELNKKKSTEEKMELSRVNVHIKEVKEIEDELISPGKRIKRALNSTGSNIVNYSAIVLEFLITVSPIIAIGGGGYYAYARIVKRKDESTGDREEK